MRSPLRKFILFALIVATCGIAVAFVVHDRSPVALAVVSMEGPSDSPVARCEIRNRGDKPIEFTINSIDQRPCYHRLEWSGRSWRRVLWVAECGMDAQARILSPGQTFSFTASIIDTSQPIRLAVSYRLDGADLTASSKTIYP